MNLSELLTSDVKPYLEYGWVCAPNAAAQALTTNTLTTLTIDTEIVDTGGNGSVATNQITLAAGTYFFQANAPLGGATGGSEGVIGLYNVSASAWVSRTHFTITNYGEIQTPVIASSQFTIASQSIFELRAVMASGGFNGPGGTGIVAMTLATAGVDQRTTLKLWKLK